MQSDNPFQWINMDPLRCKQDAQKIFCPLYERGIGFKTKWTGCPKTDVKPAFWDIHGFTAQNGFPVTL